MRKRTAGILGRAVAAVCLTLLFSLPVFCGRALAADADGIGIGIVYGYRNTAKSGQMLPVTVSFENNTGETVNGFLSLEVPGENGSVSYTSAVKIPEGSHTEKRTVTIPDALAKEEGNLLRAVLFDDYGEEIVSAQTRVTYLGSGKEVLCGILSDNAQNLKYLSGISLGTDLSTRVVTLNPADMPEDADGLNQLDVIVISSFDTDRLSGLSVAAIMNWVEDGGTLIFGTGSRKNPLGPFRTLLGNPKLAHLGIRPVDMGMQYSASGPDGAVLNLPFCSVVWEGAEVLQESFDRDNVLRKGFGKGYISVAAFDFCDVSGFCTEQPGYPQELLKGMIGQGSISRIAGSLLSAEERLTASRDLTNTYDETKVPRVAFYVIFTVVFLALAGPLLFRLLRRKGLGSYYMLGVLILTMLSVLVLWLRASATRITVPYINYGVINEFTLKADGDRDVSMRGFLDMGSPNRSAMTLELPQECTVRPVITSGNISVTAGKKTMLAVAGQNQFDTNIFQVEEKIGRTEKDCPLSASLRIGENGLEGTVENTGEMNFSGVALIFSGEIYYYGGLEPGSGWDLKVHPSRILENPVYGPVTNPDMVAEFLVSCSTDHSEKTEQQRKNLIAYCLRESSSLSEGKGLLIGFAEDYEPGFLTDSAYAKEGSALFVVEVEAGQSEETDKFRRRITTAPKVISGSYNAAENVIQGRSTTVLEYSLGSGFRLLGLEMIPLSSQLDGKYITAFSGQTAMYNYVTASYDLTDAGKTGWTAEELAPYLSPGNNLTVRFIPDEDIREDVPVFLPIPYIRGERVTRMPQDGDSGPVPETAAEKETQTDGPAVSAES